jgi:hypothetical protein
LREFLTILAGPVTTAGLLYFAVIMQDENDWALFARVDTWKMLAAANGFLLLATILPSRVEWQSRHVWNDAVALLQIPFLSRTTLERYHALFFTLTAIEAFDQWRLEESRQACLKALALSPGDGTTCRLLGFVEFFSANFHDARKYWLLALEEPDLAPSAHSGLMVNVACTDVILADDDAALARADKYSMLAAEREPNSAGIQATRGEVLIVLGQAEQGIALIRKHLDQIKDPRFEALFQCFLAVGEMRLGRGEVAKECRERAQQLDPHCVLLPMADAAIGK